jgi:hypothetical protein
MSTPTEGRTTTPPRDRRLGAVVITALLVGVVGGATGDHMVARPAAAVTIARVDTPYVFTPETACVKLVRTYLFHSQRPDERVRRDTTSKWWQAQHCAFAQDELLRTRMHNIAKDAALQLATMHLKIPEYHDQQRLRSSAGTLGPVAGIFLSPFLTDISNPYVIRAHRQRPGMLVAFVVVMRDSTEVLPPTYQALGLTWGMNCIWLQDSVGMRAYASHPKPDQPCRPVTPAELIPLSVDRLPIPRPKPDNAPGARFTDDDNGNPLLGVPCYDGWCDIGPAPGFPRRSNASQAHLANKPGYYVTADGPWPRRETQSKGWYDEQFLEIVDAAFNWRETNVRITIVPRRRVNDLPSTWFVDTWRHVSDIHLSSAPPTSSKFSGIYYSGWNKVELMNDVRTGSGWKYRIRSPGQIPYIMYVTHVDLHQDAPVPGTARWRYSMGDPGEWGPCDENACCPTGGT